MPSPDDIRRALDVLGINPDDARNGCLDQCWGQHVASLVDKLDSPLVPEVTADTPAGTVVNPSFDPLLIDSLSDLIDGFGWLGTLRALDSLRPDPEDVKCGWGPCNNRLTKARYHDGPQWCSKEHRANSEPSPVRVGQVRAMPVTVERYDGGFWWLRCDDQAAVIVHGSWVALWPVISEPEEAPDE